MSFRPTSFPRVLVLLSFCYLISNQALSQGITFDLVSKKAIAVRNNNGFSTRVLVYDNGRTVYDRILRPQQTGNFSYSYSPTGVRKIRYKAVYDDTSLEVDLDRIEATKRARDRRRAEEGIWRALGAIIDQTFFDGAFSTLFEIGNYGRMIFNGATEEEWAEALLDSAVGFGIDQSFDKNYQKGLAAGAYELAKSMQSREYKDLQDWLVFFMKKRESRYIKSGHITDTARLPRKMTAKYPHVSLSVGYPLNQRFVENALNEGQDFRSGPAQTFENQQPFELRLAYQGKSTIGFFAEYGKTNVFKNTDTPSSKYLNYNSAFRFTSYSLGINPTFSYLEVGMGASFLQQENFLIETLTNQLQANSTTTKWGGFLEPRINIDLGNWVTLFGSWRATMFGDKEVKETLLLYQNFKVGIDINLMGKALNFSN